MTRREMTTVGFGLVLFITITSLACAAQPDVKGADSGQQVVASFGDQTITAAQLDELAAGQLMQLQQQMYDVRRQALEQEIYQRLLTKAAKAADMSVDDYRQQQLEAVAGEPSEEQIKQVMDQYRARLDKDDEKARQQVVDYLSQQSRQQAEMALKDKLFNEGGVQISLEPPRMEVPVQAFNPTMGPADAPITLIEYTDFQCPYCSRVQPTLQQIRDTYGNRVRFVFKNLPLPMHSQARLAAEAGLCAADQGQFWPLHDWMFDNHTNLGRDAIIAAAGEIGLNTDELAVCIDNKTRAVEVQQDMEEARGLGITGTPGFLINGRVLKGAVPFEAFADVINDELRKAGLDVPEPKQAATERTEAKAEAKTEAPAS